MDCKASQSVWCSVHCYALPERSDRGCTYSKDDSIDCEAAQSMKLRCCKCAFFWHGAVFWLQVRNACSPSWNPGVVIRCYNLKPTYFNGASLFILHTGILPLARDGCPSSGLWDSPGCLGCTKNGGCVLWHRRRRSLKRAWKSVEMVSVSWVDGNWQYWFSMLYWAAPFCRFAGSFSNIHFRWRCFCRVTRSMDARLQRGKETKETQKLQVWHLNPKFIYQTRQREFYCEPSQ